MQPVRIAVQLHPQHGEWDALRRAAGQAEEMGADVLYTWDHFFPLYGPPDGHHFECWSVLAGTALPAGANLTLNLGSANHDETRWDDPEVFDLTRPRQAHAGFGFRAHMCLGQHLAKMETEALVHALVQRLPGLRLAPEAEPPFVAGTLLRSPARLDVVWDA